MVVLVGGNAYGRGLVNSDSLSTTVSLPVVMVNYEDLPPTWDEGLAPGVNWGLAAAYPDDVGITQNPYVLAAEGFETGSVTIPTEEDRYLLNTTVVSSISYTGRYSGEHRWPEGYNGPTTRFAIPESAHQGSQPTYFVRMCMNFDHSFHPGADNLEAGVGIKGFGIVSEPFGGGLNIALRWNQLVRCSSAVCRLGSQFKT